MNQYANLLKKRIFDIVDAMAETPEVFSLTGNSAFSRKRIWDFSTVIKFILSFGSNSLGYEIGDFFEYKKGFPTVSSFVQQRKKLDFSAMEHLFHQFTEQSLKKPRLFKGYRLLAIDGSGISSAYNPKEGNTLRNDQVSAFHLNSLYDICNKLFINVVVNKESKIDECGSACNLVDQTDDRYPVIFIADRGYENYNLMAHIEERLFDYVIRVRDADNSCMVSGLKLPQLEEYDITKPVIITRKSTGPALINPQKYKYVSKKIRFDYISNSKSPDYELIIRLVRFKLTDDTYEVLATSLPKEIFSVEDLKEIYRQRWGIETGFRELKYIMGLSAFHSKQENSILQEVFARLTMYNFSMFITMKIHPKEKDRRYQLQVNFTQAINICLNYFRYRGKEPPYDIEATIQRFLLPIRPNRRCQHRVVSTTVVSFNYRLS